MLTVPLSFLWFTAPFTIPLYIGLALISGKRHWVPPLVIACSCTLLTEHFVTGWVDQGSHVSKKLLRTGPGRPEWSSVASYLQLPFRLTPERISSRPVHVHLLQEPG